MKRKILSALLCFALLVCLLPACAPTSQAEESIVILYENDVHCAVEGYAKLGALKAEMAESYDHVGVVSVGDFVQGGSLGVISQGGYIIELMNLVGYDALTLGNHEFDYRLPRLFELTDMMNTKPVCCNFQKIGEDESVFDAYSMVSYGDTDIAYVGITTPSTISSSSPSQFKNEQDEYIYTFNVSNLYQTVQDTIDAARAEGADYIIALSHIGYEEDEAYEDVEDLIANTQGLDVVLDGHSHSVIEGMTLQDKQGEDVLLTSTGTKFEHIGKLTIEDGEISTELVKVADYEKTSADITEYVAAINQAYQTLGERKIGESEVALITHDTDGNRLVRLAETNLGNFCADAYRAVTGADIGYVNGGGLRDAIPAGDITFNHILNVHPFNNQIVVCEVTGQMLLDMLEFSLISYPEENGSFPHVSGMRFSVDTSVECKATQDENGVFTGMSGEYRVHDVKVLDKESGEYLPLELTKTYTFASHDYMILLGGSGMSMFKNATILQNNGMLDVEALEVYLTEHLGGHIGEDYATLRPAITFENQDE